MIFPCPHFHGGVSRCDAVPTLAVLNDPTGQTTGSLDQGSLERIRLGSRTVAQSANTMSAHTLPIAVQARASILRQEAVTGGPIAGAGAGAGFGGVPAPASAPPPPVVPIDPE